MRFPIAVMLEELRRDHPSMPFTEFGDAHGYFEFGPLRIISSGASSRSDRGENGEWEHVSVSCADRCPTWEEMCVVKDLFWSDTETVIQFHPKAEAYVNHHPYCLHLWRKHGTDYELPPRSTLA